VVEEKRWQGFVEPCGKDQSNKRNVSDIVVGEGGDANVIASAWLGVEVAEKGYLQNSQYIFTLNMAVALVEEAASTPEMSVNFYRTTRRIIPEDGRLHTRRHEKLKSDVVQIVFDNQIMEQTLESKYYDNVPHITDRI
jgi:hypothetical protein